MTIFEWDEQKNQANIAKHGVSFEVAEKAFLDPRRVIIPDNKHSSVEKRLICIAEIGEEVVTVRFTYRDKKIRIFGAGYWRKERKLYKRKDSK